MRNFVAVLLIALLTCAPQLAFAQQPQPATSTAPKKLTPDQHNLLRLSVSNTGEVYRRMRTQNGVGNIIGAVIVGGFGGYIYTIGHDQNDPGVQVIGIGLALSAVPQLVSGIWNLFYKTPQEEIAQKLLANDQLLDADGMIFLEQEARRARRDRLVGGTTQIVQGAALLGSYYLYAKAFGSADILLIFFSVAAGLTTLGGIIKLVGLSGPEKSYRDLKEQMGDGGTTVPAPPPSNNRISRLRVVPAVLGNEGKVAAGLGLSFGF